MSQRATAERQAGFVEERGSEESRARPFDRRGSSAVDWNRVRRTMVVHSDVSPHSWFSYDRDFE